MGSKWLKNIIIFLFGWKNVISFEICSACSELRAPYSPPTLPTLLISDSSSGQKRTRATSKGLKASLPQLRQVLFLSNETMKKVQLSASYLELLTHSESSAMGDQFKLRREQKADGFLPPLLEAFHVNSFPVFSPCADQCFLCTPHQSGFLSPQTLQMVLCSQSLFLTSVYLLSHPFGPLPVRLMGCKGAGGCRVE